MKELEETFKSYFEEDNDYWIDEESGDKYIDYFHIESQSEQLAEVATEHFISGLEILIANNSDDFDRGKGVVILKNFIANIKTKKEEL